MTKQMETTNTSSVVEPTTSMCRCPQQKNGQTNILVMILGTGVFLLSFWCFCLNNDVQQLKLAVKELTGNAERKQMAEDKPEFKLFRNDPSTAESEFEHRALVRSLVKRNAEDSTADDPAEPRESKSRKISKRGSNMKKMITGDRAARSKRHILTYHENRLRRNRAVAIHVKAQGAERGIGGTFLPGRTLTDWAPPDSHFKGFGTRHLNNDGYFTVPVAGVYFVYSQVVFNVTNLPFMVSEIGVNVDGQSTFSRCQFSNTLTRSTPRASSTRKRFVTCHSNGIVYMKANHGVSLSVNPPSVEVFLAPQYTYFGAFLIGL
uniref:ectodermal dysplasia/anhidrotic-like isoform X2 n=1 Tax=Ciona intestinalis TaxID=7719 RepID=UPI0005217F2F|nr:ectodermal dysplasia/anhidrotic-like isoform X2 [Ciona intestinalis]|eukprot:XP_009858905.1 ectodermal dysplasia/anhidrotic-like isoform X2 [Ciona intestinalis]